MEGQKYSPKIGFGLNMLELESLYLKKTDQSPVLYLPLILYMLFLRIIFQRKI